MVRAESGASPPPTGDEYLIAKFNEQWGYIQKDFVRPIEDTPEAKRDCFEKTMSRGIGACLDDAHSSYHSASAMRLMAEDQSGEFFGIGASLSYFYGEVMIDQLIDGSPAALSGKLEPGDIIVGIDGEDVREKPLNYVVKKIRGAAGTEVTLTIKRGGRTIEPVVLKRAKIETPSVEFVKIDKRTALIKVSSFGDKTHWDFVKALGDAFPDMRSKADLAKKRLVIDLRNNPGGLLNVARNMSALFAGSLEDVCVTEKMRSGEQVLRVGDFTSVADFQNSFAYVSKGLGILAKTPTVVLVNEHSASASEIFSGLLQQWGRATVVGSRTYGKGSIQAVIPLADGDGLRLTIAEYLVGDKRTKVNGVGITPDILVENTPLCGDEFKAQRGKKKPLVDLAHDAQLKKALEVLRGVKKK
ncbi:MAG: S41 family peptidase [Candidatus Niyogibacteria bacterium]|nr:S41 family peptidase [Candidatus Niyogibacteria bacterium]